ncbi:hypothetical protein VNI00_005357 [Paramarasmius palmivorus]|uniref:Major facilitator superfamily (MFS) profile domain-containing protein n=1 Tax=Paramarasmius palmivorus TaxID=297713 RepID=A0AAW0DDG1_9AGAR
MILISCALTYACLIASAFSTNIVHVFLLQGAFLGFAQGIAMPLYVSLPSQWFNKKRGLASGFAVSGSGIGGGVQTLIVRQLIVNLGLKKTMIIYAHMHVVAWIIAFFLIKERPLPPHLRGAKKRWMPKHIGGSFISVASSIFFGIFGYLSPYYFSSTYTKEFVTYLDPKSLLVTVPLIVMNFSRQIAGSAIGGAILSASGGDWKAVTFYSGGMQIIGAVCILYARFAKDRRLWALV